MKDSGQLSAVNVKSTDVARRAPWSLVYDCANNKEVFKDNPRGSRSHIRILQMRCHSSTQIHGSLVSELGVWISSPGVEGEEIA